ncbi:MAG: motility protein A [Christensenellales bacterium]
MDFATLFGIGLGAVLIVIAIVLSGQLVWFWDFVSILITMGGTLASTMISFRGKDMKNVIPVLKKAFKKSNIDLNKDIDLIIDIANVARREGLLALDEQLTQIDDPFLRKGVSMIVDGTDIELIKSILQTEVYFVQARHQEGQNLFNTMAGFAPAYGLIGTIIGLILMLQTLDDLGSLGKKMAVALVTTFYGSVLANLIFTPIAKKLKSLSDEEVLQKELYIEGLLSIQEGENPRIIREKLNSFIARKELKAVSAKPEVVEIKESRNAR